MRKRWPWLKHLFADGAYDRTQLMDKAAFRDFTIQIKRSDAAMGFEVIPRRWVVERTFAWMTRWRRLVRDYEERIDCSEAMIHVALGSVLLRRISSKSAGRFSPLGPRGIDLLYVRFQCGNPHSEALNLV